MSAVDAARGVRVGEELDVEAVTNWLKRDMPDLQGMPEVTQYVGGASNWTYRLNFADRDLVLRRPPAGSKAKSAHDMAREYALQKRLRPLYPLVPEMVALCQDPSVLGSDFYLMERLDGLILRANLPKDVSLSTSQVRRLCINVLDQLIALHNIDYRAAGLSDIGKGAGYCRRQVDGWSNRYMQALTWNVPRFRKVRAWLHRNVPEDSGTCIIHNDWRFDNVVLDRRDPTRVVGVLDWELATLGDPLMDLGCMLAYWVQSDDDPLMRSARRQPTNLEGMLTRSEVVAYYMQATGRKSIDWTFYEVFGLFRLAAIAQQIYFRYHHKQTRNPAFRHYWLLIHALHRRCLRAIATSPHR